MKTLSFFFVLLIAATSFAITTGPDSKTMKQSSCEKVIDNLNDDGKDPFSPVKSISFLVNEPVYIYIEIVKPNGEFVKKIIAGNFNPGRYTCEWDGKDASEMPVKSGVYQFRIKTEKYEYQQTLAYLQ